MVAGCGGGGARLRVAHSGSFPVVRVSPDPVGVQIPAGFLGLSIEWWAVEAYAGRDPGAVNPVLVRLVRNLMPDQTGVLRIGGVTTDSTWWPVAGVARPRGVHYTVTAQRLAVIRAFAEEVGARLILGVNLEADSTIVARAEATAMLAIIGSSRIAAFELGNEPELYGNPAFAWYRRKGRSVPGRPPDWDMTKLTTNFANIGSAIPRIGLAGPAAGAAEWLDQLGRFIAGQRRLAMITVHSYPFEACSASPAMPWYPTISRLLSPAASIGQVKTFRPYLTTAHAHHLPLRIDETNTVSCGDPPGIANTFAMALWAIDGLYADAQAGVDGVNVHTWPGAIYQLFTFKHLSSGWQALVEPEYYGLVMFARGAPAGSRLLNTSSPFQTVRAWATRARDGTIRITLINDDQAAAHRLAVQVPQARGPASLERLIAPSAGATSGVTLAGQSFSKTGQLGGPLRITTITPTGGDYRLSLPPASAALLTAELSHTPASLIVRCASAQAGSNPGSVCPRRVSTAVRPGHRSADELTRTTVSDRWPRRAPHKRLGVGP